jgi:hypothetical protein
VADQVTHSALLCDWFYELKDLPGKGKGHVTNIVPGQLVLADLVYPNVPPWIAEVTGIEPSATVTYKIRKLDPANPAPTHFPIRDMNLRADENLYLLKGKPRPGVVLQTVDTDFYNPRNPEPYASVIPCYTFKEKHTQEYRVRVAAFESLNLFYLPSAHEGIKEESILRFEHVQPIPMAGIRPVFIDGKKSFLSDEAWTILQHWYHRFLTGRVLDHKLQEHIDAYRTLLLETYGLA